MTKRGGASETPGSGASCEGHMWWVAGGRGNAKTRVPPLLVRCSPDAHRFEFEVEGGNRWQSDQIATYFSFDFARVANVAHGGDCTISLQVMLRDRLCRGWRRWWRRARPCFQECPRVAGSRVCQEPLTAEPPRWLVGRALEPCRNHTGTTLEPRWNHARATPMLRPRRTRSGHYGCWKPYISMGPEDMQLLRPRVAPRTARA